jgi:hypothetical protein
MRALIACLLVSTTGCAQGGEDFHHVHAHAWRGVPPPRRHLVARSTTVVDLDLGTGFVIASELRLSMYVHTAKQIYHYTCIHGGGAVHMAMLTLSPLVVKVRATVTVISH